MPIDPEEVRRIARLARLEYPRVAKDGRFVEPAEHLLSQAEVERLAQDLGRILAHVQVLAEVDTRQVEPTLHGVPLPTRERADEPGEVPGPERLLAGAPHRLGDHLAVPKIVE